MADAEPPAEKPTDDPAHDEFAGMAPTPRRRSPVMALAVIGLAAVLTWHLRADLRYAFCGRAPGDLGDARTLAARGVALEDNRYVTLSGLPERRWALFIEPRGERERQSFFRLLGTGTRVLVRAADSTGRPEQADRWTGRLRRFDLLPYAQSLRDYYRKETTANRYLSLDALKLLLAGKPVDLRDRAGEPMALGASEPLLLDVDYPGQLTLSLSKDKFPSEPDARHELDQLRLKVQPAAPTDEDYRYTLTASQAERNAVIPKLEEKEIGFMPRHERYPVTRAQLALDGEQLRLPGGAAIAWSQLSAASVAAPIEIPADAFVLVEGEAPSAFWWAPAVVALLVAFAAFNLWYLVRARPRART
jgi:hypothetical protein